MQLRQSLTPLFFVASLFLISLNVSATSLDSLRLEIDHANKRAWIIHKVEPKETLFSLSRRYKVTVEEILAENTAAKELKAETILRIPYKDYERVYTASQNTTNGKKTHTVETGETLFKISQKYNVSVKDLQEWNKLEGSDIKVGQVLLIGNTSNPPLKTSGAVKATMHTVKEDEYPYMIAKQYNVKLTELLEWNNMSQEDKLRIGQTLEVYPSGYKKETGTGKPDNKTTETTTKNTTTSEVTKNTNTPEVKTTNNTTTPSRQVTNISGYTKIVERGSVGVIEDDQAANFTGLHSDAPIGTIVAVKSEETGESVFVRIVGKLPEAASGKVLMKVSKNVLMALGAKNDKINAEISYIP